MSGGGWFFHSSGVAFRLAPALITVKYFRSGHDINRRNDYYIKAEEKRISATAMTFMMESTVYLLLDYKKRKFCKKNKDSLSHQIRTKLSKRLKKTRKKTGKQQDTKDDYTKEVHRKGKLRKTTERL
jgi:predicted ribosome quality control (RQC) complex YloA/Tae2 family protein